MVRLSSELLIRAPIERCFDLARDMETHAQSMAYTGERIVSGPTGRLELGDEVTFEASHFGIKQRLTSKVIQMERPVQFTDEMVRGAFRSLRHIHAFKPVEGGTIMTDTLEFSAPLGPLGWLAERLILKRYMERLIRRRAETLKQIAEQSLE